MPYGKHLESHQSLITPYEETRAGFISLALEKNRRATPFIEEAKALKSIAQNAKKPNDLLNFDDIENSLLVASGISDKAKHHLLEDDKKEAVNGLIKNFLEPSGRFFVDELIYRFLLTRGDSLGGGMRNFAGMVGTWKYTRILISTLSIRGKKFTHLDSINKQWMQPDDDPNLEKRVKGLQWTSNGKSRVLMYNLTVPTIDKNVDLCLLDCSSDEIMLGKDPNSAHHKPEKYLALGELKGGIDPAGADEHWKTANSALGRIRDGFADTGRRPCTFFIGAAIEKSMAEEIHQQLENKTLTNGANLTVEKQVVSLCSWLINL